MLIRPSIRHQWLAAIFIVLCSPSNGFSESFHPINLGIPYFPPYTSLEDGKFKGLAIGPVRHILDKLNVIYQFQQLDTYGHLLKGVKSDRIDGFFLASQNPERDLYAEFSKAVMINRWVWYVKADSKWDIKSREFFNQAKVGSIINTNTYRWIVKKGYQAKALGLELLPVDLKLGKLDAVFAAEAVFDQVAAEQGLIGDNHFKKIVEISKPFGIYISKKYLAQNPDFMNTLNKIIEEGITY